VSHSLEEKLEAMRGPAMPSDVEARIRKRIVAEVNGPIASASRRYASKVTPMRLLVLIALMLAAAWIVYGSMIPTLRSVWERTHCAPVSTK